ncbi:hypothetical protein [Actinomyces minihominis]|uniref:hypothetical protein n=1 Tax=Actinomyces minihominis TaxID=2002838 RepID=UPI000C07D01A|nr:hypothetical protein [Actinomyces minihominis]
MTPETSTHSVRRADFRRPVRAAVAVGAAAILLASCTSSIPAEPGLTWGGSAQSGETTELVTVAVPEGSMLPLDGLEALSKELSFGFRQVVLDPPAVAEGGLEGVLEDVDALLGVDETWLNTSGVQEALDLTDGEMKTVPYGSDSACVLVDRSWFSANNLAIPSELAAVKPKELEGIVATFNPMGSPYALALLPLWKDHWKSWQASREEAEGTQSGTETASPVVAGMIGSVLEPLRHPNNLGTDTRYRVLADTCVQRQASLLAVTANPERSALVSELADLLTSARGQAIVADYALAFPLGEDVEAQEPFPVEEVIAGLKKWTELFAPAASSPEDQS